MACVFVRVGAASRNCACCQQHLQKITSAFLHPASEPRGNPYRKTPICEMRSTFLACPCRAFRLRYLALLLVYRIGGAGVHSNLGYIEGLAISHHRLEGRGFTVCVKTSSVAAVYDQAC